MFKIGDRVRIVKHESFPDNHGIGEQYIGTTGTVCDFTRGLLVVQSDDGIPIPWFVPRVMAERLACWEPKKTGPYPATIPC